MANRRAASDVDPLWYKDAIIYELHVRAFSDSAGDGVGDFDGLTTKLDYLRDLGITAVWLLPFYPSPLKDDGYDTADYVDVHPSYGTLRDFRRFQREAKARGLKVITELVLNHTSDQHPWFQRARRAPKGSALRSFYVWSDDPERYRDARIIFKDFEHSNWSWDPVAGQYYWHRFYAHQPDLNWDSPQVRRTMFQVVDFWLGQIGVDGLRLDAVPYLFEREGTNCENLPETHQALKELRAHVDRKFGSKMLLAEANQWPEDAVAYFGAGDECHTAFHFPLMPRMFMAIQTEDRFPVVDMLEQTPPIPESCQWVLFLRNHDELTLEMVTDEERDYMYRSYAQDTQARINLGIRRRLAPLLGNSRRKIELMNGLLLSLPGTPVVYYGDEIGMGDNFYLGDRNGVRTPMQWSGDRNAGFSRADPARLYAPVIMDAVYGYESINVEVQQNSPQSLLWWMKRILSLRKQYRAFGRGTLEFLYPDNNKILAYVRTYEEERILVVANLSRFSQHAELNLSGLRGLHPVELFGRSSFPAIGETPYSVSLGPHGFYWFALQRTPPSARASDVATTPDAWPQVTWDEQWQEHFAEELPERLAAVLPAALRSRSWFWGRPRQILRAEVVDAVPVTDLSALALVKVDYVEGEAERYLLSVAAAPGDAGEELAARNPAAVLARLKGPADGKGGVLYDAVWDRRFCESLLAVMGRRTGLKGRAGELEGWSDEQIRRTRALMHERVPGQVTVEAGDASLAYGSRFILRLIRRPEEEHPDLEVMQFLHEHGFAHCPPVRGVVSYRTENGPSTLAVLQDYVPHETDGWRGTLDELGRYFERVLTAQPAISVPAARLPELAASEVPAEARQAIGPFLQTAELLGQRTAEMHLALASDPADPRFAPEPFSALYQRSLVQSMRNLSRSVMHDLRRRARTLPEATQADVQRALQLEPEILKRSRSAFETRFRAKRIRYHGNLHLGRVLYTGRDFSFLFFESEPGRPLGERRIKRSPLRDVATMLRSFHYVAAHALSGRVSSGAVRAEDVPQLEPALRGWRTWIGAAFLRRYLQTAAEAPFVHPGAEELRAALTAYLLERTLHEIRYELEHRPDWVTIPLGELLDLMKQG
ncbi:MAG TPA: maltose alpha-D-glucosyltransferase [Vicinamibacteria bacterium]|nr:maltose alpha-D-glucosyltransferase [Vicinamibacteria bacterium]